MNQPDFQPANLPRCVGAWHGRLNGTDYALLMVVMGDSTIRLFSLNITTGNFTDVTAQEL